MITGDIKMDIFLSTIIFFPTVLVLICAGENYPREDSYGHADLLQVATAKDCVIDTPSCVNKSLFIVISRQRTGTHFLAQILMLNAHIYHGPETLFHHEMLSIQDFCMSINAYYEMICHEGSKLGGIEGYGGIMMHWDFNRPIEGKHRTFSPRDVFVVLARSNIKVVLYERRNTLAQAISVMLHRQHGYLGTDSLERVYGMRAKKLNSTAEAIFQEAQEILQGFARVRFEISQMQMEVPIRVMSVFYEDMQVLQGSTSLQIHTFVGVRTKSSTNADGAISKDPTRKYLIKVHTGSVFQYLDTALAEDVRNRFRNTPLAWMVVDSEQSG